MTDDMQRRFGWVTACSANRRLLIGSMRAEARQRTVSGVAAPTPRETRVWGYELRNGMHVPTESEARFRDRIRRADR